MPEGGEPYIVQGPHGPINLGTGPEGEEAARQYRRALAFETDPQLSDPGQNELYGGTLPGGNLPWEHLQQLIAALFGTGQLPLGPIGEPYRGQTTETTEVPETVVSLSPQPSATVDTDVVNGEGRKVVARGMSAGGSVPALDASNQSIDTGWNLTGTGKSYDDVDSLQNWTVPRDPTSVKSMGEPMPPQPNVTVETLPDIESASPKSSDVGVFDKIKQAFRFPSGSPSQRPEMARIAEELIARNKRDALAAAKRRMSPDSDAYGYRPKTSGPLSAPALTERQPPQRPK